MKTPRVSYADAGTLSAQDLVEASKKPTPNATFDAIHDTHNTTMRNLEELLSVISKVSEQKSTNRHNVRRKKVEKKSEQVIHKYPKRQQKNQAPNPRVNI